MTRKRTKTRERKGKQTGVLFASDPDLWHNAYLDRAPMAWWLYADGYRKAANLLVKQYETFYDRNALIYPIAFSYRQYIELTLKGFILDSNEVVAKAHSLPKSHNLDELWSLCKKIIHERNLPVRKAELTAIENGIREFSKFDPTSEAFRYPANKRGGPSISPAAVKVLSIRGLAAAMDKLAERLRNLERLLGADMALEKESRNELYKGL